MTSLGCIKGLAFDTALLSYPTSGSAASLITELRRSVTVHLRPAAVRFAPGAAKCAHFAAEAETCDHGFRRGGDELNRPPAFAHTLSRNLHIVIDFLA